MDDNKQAGEELAHLTGQFKREVTVGGAKLEIAPLRARQFVATLAEVGKLTEGAMQMLSGGRSFNPLQMILAGGEPALNIIAIAAGKDRAWVDELELDDLARVAGAAYEVNEDFFDRRLAPALEGSKLVGDLKALAGAATRRLADRMISFMLEVFERAQAAAGRAPSSDSSGTGTGAPTSGSTP